MPDLVDTILSAFLAGSFLILVVALILVVLLVPSMIYTSRLRKKSKHHYRIARGTLHKRQLHSSLSNLQREIRSLRIKIGRIERQLTTLEGNRYSELRSALCRYLVNNRLKEVKGIGPELSRRIVHSCFRGRLGDLGRARHITGVGPTRQRAINRWITRYERDLPLLLEEEFPGKARLEAKYEDQERKLKRTLDTMRSDLEQRLALFRAGQTAFKRLSAVRLSHFTRALSGKPSDSPVPEWYFAGVYPPWESAPEWFVTLLENYGG